MEQGAGNAGERPRDERAVLPASLTKGLRRLPPRGKQGTLKNYKRQLRSFQNLMALSASYRAVTPKGKRSYTAWLRFLRKNGPKYLGAKQ